MTSGENGGRPRSEDPEATWGEMNGRRERTEDGVGRLGEDRGHGTRKRRVARRKKGGAPIENRGPRSESPKYSRGRVHCRSGTRDGPEPSRSSSPSPLSRRARHRALGLSTPTARGIRLRGPILRGGDGVEDRRKVGVSTQGFGYVGLKLVKGRVEDPDF